MQPTDSPVPRPGQPPALEVLLDDQSRRWQLGERCLVEAYLHRHPDLAGGVQQLLELIEREVALRQAHGEKPQLDEYLRRFPNLAVPLRERLEHYLAHALDAPPPYVGDEARLLAALTASETDAAAAPAKPAIQSAAALIAAIGGARLLTLAQLTELAQQLQPRYADARALARELLQRGWLTPYQVNQLFQGKRDGLVLGSYLLLERLGEGGMGQVFKARHQKMARTVALKVIRKERLADAHAIRRFQHEVRAGAQLSHANVVHALDADQVGDTHILIMEYVEGADLSRLVRKQGPLPVAQACDFIRQAALGLQHAHEHGLVHRDIKPSNLLACQQANGGAIVKLLDLGLARLTQADGEASSTLTESGAVLGTPDYMAPEQARKSHQVDIRADLYSLGCTFYYLLTGRPPFPGGSLGEKLLQQMMDEPRPVQELRPEVPAPVVAVIARLMAKRPEERYQTPADLAAVLEVGLRTGNWPESGGESASHDCPGPGAEEAPSVTLPGFSSIMDPPSRPAVDAPWRRRRAKGKRRWLLLNGLGVLMLLVLASGVVFLLQRRGTRPTERTQPAPATEEERASQALQPLQARAGDPAADRDKLKQELIRFRMVFPGTRAAWEAGALLRELPSPLDTLRRDRLPEWERPPWQPPEVVQVLGDHRGRHWNGVLAVALSPDGKLAAGSDGRAIVLWDTATMRERHRWQAHDARLVALCFVEGGRDLVSSDAQGAVCRWQAPAGKLVRQVGTKTAVSWLSADGKRGLGADGKKGFFYDLDSGALLARFEGHTDLVMAAALSADGKRALTGGKDATVRLWDTATGKELATLKGHTTQVSGVAFTLEGKHALSADTHFASRIRYWDLETGKQVWEAPGSINGCKFAVLPDGKQVLAFTDVLQLWNLDTGKEVRRLETVGVNAAVLSADGRLAVTGGSDGTVRLWDLQTGQQLHPSEGPPSAANQVWLTPDGRDAVIFSWGQRAAGLWDVVTGKGRGRFEAAEDYFLWGTALSPDGQRLLGINDKRGLSLWDVPSDKPRATWKMPWAINSLAFSPDGRQALLGTHSKSHYGGQIRSGDFNVQLIDLRSGKELKSLPGHKDIIRSVAFSPDGRLALFGGGTQYAASDYALRLWDLQSGHLLRTLAGHTNQVTRVAFSPDGRRFASSSADATVRLWELEGPRWKEPLVLQHNKGVVDYVGTVVFAPDGQALASASSLGRVIIWDLSGNKRKEWQLPGPVNGLSFAADGRHLATANNNGTVYILRLSAPRAQGGR